MATSIIIHCPTCDHYGCIMPPGFAKDIGGLGDVKTWTCKECGGKGMEALELPCEEANRRQNEDRNKKRQNPRL